MTSLLPVDTFDNIFVLLKTGGKNIDLISFDEKARA